MGQNILNTISQKLYGTNINNNDAVGGLAHSVDILEQAVAKSLEQIDSKIGEFDSNFGTFQETIDGKAPISHESTDTTYGVGTTVNYGHVKISNDDVNSVENTDGLVAGMDHTHSNYSLTSHTHSDYSLTSHTHSNYSLTSHTHSNYSPTSHTHSNYSLTSHTHSIANITKLQETINSINSALEDLQKRISALEG